jgi:hypothetical protein
MRYRGIEGKIEKRRGEKGAIESGSGSLGRWIERKRERGASARSTSRSLVIFVVTGALYEMAADAAQFNKKGSSVGKSSFTEKLDSESLAFFNQVAAKPFSQQATAFLNAYWPEVKDEAEFIYAHAWEKIKYADMHFKGIQLIYSTSKNTDSPFFCSPIWRGV